MTRCVGDDTTVAHGLAPLRAHVLNLGCKVNRVESDRIEEDLAGMGVLLVPVDEADFVVINTCAVTGEAQAKTRKATRHAANLPNLSLVIACGCAANLFSDELCSLSDKVRVVRDKASVAQYALAELGEQYTDRIASSCTPATPHQSFRARRGVKVQDGCDNRCSYCIVWKARGDSASAQLAEIERQVRTAVTQGALEIVLSGINLGKFSSDDEDGRHVGLAELVELVREWGAPLVRLSSIEPPDLHDDLLHVMAKDDAVCAHVHLPLQSGSPSVLKRMNRSYDDRAFLQRVSTARDIVPHLSVTTDVIVGFPGETDAEFEQTLRLCRECGFSKIHAFRYSPRPQTPAATMENQVHPTVKRERSERLQALSRELRMLDAASRIGRTERALVETIDPAGAAVGSSASYHDIYIDASSHTFQGPAVTYVKPTSLTSTGTLVCHPLSCGN